MDYLYVVGGLVALFLGGEALVRGAVAVAARFAIPPLLIGLTVVGFGTSTPELLVSVEAALRGVPDIAVGNIVGSNIGNILLIVGAAALVWPIVFSGAGLRRDTVAMVLSAVVLIVPFWMGSVGRVTGVGLVAALVLYLSYAYRMARKDGVPDDKIAQGTLLPSLLWVGAGLVVLVLGARFLVEGSVSIARDFGISEAFIGLTIVAIGTSLPELATSVVAAFRRQSEIAIGNVIGSNLFNVLGILGVTAVIKPIPVADRFVTFDLPVMIGVSLLLALLIWTRPSIGRAGGALLLAAYGVFVLTAYG